MCAIHRLFHFVSEPERVLLLYRCSVAGGPHINKTHTPRRREQQRAGGGKARWAGGMAGVCRVRKDETGRFRPVRDDRFAQVL